MLMCHYKTAYTVPVATTGQWAHITDTWSFQYAYMHCRHT